MTRESLETMVSQLLSDDGQITVVLRPGYSRAGRHSFTGASKGEVIEMLKEVKKCSCPACIG